MKFLSRFAVLLKRLGLILLTLFIIAVIVRLYATLLPKVWYREHLVITLIALWLLTAYFVLPRLHRFLSRIYLPPYFVGRSRTADGLLADPVNLAVNGNKKALIRAMEAAGWQQADELKAKTAWKIAYSGLLRKSYPNAPVSPLFLFGEKQTLAFQKEVDSNPRRRHHVRFWRVPRGWYLPGGYKVDWIGGATYDAAVGFSLFTMQITHSIDSDVDKERNFLIKTLQDADVLKSSTRIEHYFTHYQTRNGGGHKYITDGSFVIADLLGESHARSESGIQHFNLDSIQQEIYNLARAKSLPIDKKDAKELIGQMEDELEDVRAAFNKKAGSEKVTQESVDVLIKSVQLIAALGKDTAQVYREKMDKNWEKHWKQAEAEKYGLK